MQRAALGTARNGDAQATQKNSYTKMARTAAKKREISMVDIKGTLELNCVSLAHPLQRKKRHWLQVVHTAHI